MILRKAKHLEVGDYIQIGMYTYAVVSIVDHHSQPKKLRLSLVHCEDALSICAPIPKGNYIELNRNDLAAIGVIHQPHTPSIPEE